MKDEMTFEQWQREYASRFMGRLMTDSEYRLWQQMHVEKSESEKRGWNAALASRSADNPEGSDEVSRVVDDVVRALPSFAGQPLSVELSTAANMIFERLHKLEDARASRSTRPDDSYPITCQRCGTEIGYVGAGRESDKAWAKEVAASRSVDTSERRLYTKEDAEALCAIAVAADRLARTADHPAAERSVDTREPHKHCEHYADLPPEGEEGYGDPGDGLPCQGICCECGAENPSDHPAAEPADGPLCQRDLDVIFRHKKPPAEPVASQLSQQDYETRSYTIRICDACMRLEGEMCNNPECVFIRKTMAEVLALQDALLLRHDESGYVAPPDTAQSAVNATCRFCEHNTHEGLLCLKGVGRFTCNCIGKYEEAQPTVNVDIEAIIHRCRLTLNGMITVSELRRVAAELPTVNVEELEANNAEFRSVLTELLRLDDWRRELAEEERLVENAFARGTALDDSQWKERRARLKANLTRYGREEAAALGRAREVLNKSQ